MTVPVAPDRAFAAFADLGSWWPPEFTWSQDVLDAIGMDSRTGGLLFERGPHGFTVHWGRVLAWEPPDRLAFTWQISPERVPEPNPAKASTVDVRFAADGAGTTRVEVAHAHFDRHGDGGDGYRAAMAGQGWPYALERYAAALS